MLLSVVALSFDGEAKPSSSKAISMCEVILGRRQILNRSYQIANGQVKVAFFDADSTLRVSKSGSVTADTPDDVQLIPGVAEKIKELNSQGYLIAIVSNQGGVAAGKSSLEVADQALLKTIELLNNEGAIVHYYDFAEAWNHNRKPQVGMAETLESILRADHGKLASIARKDSFMVGDAAYGPDDFREDLNVWGADISNSDRLFAKNFGIEFFEAVVYFNFAEALARLQPRPKYRPETPAGRLFVPYSQDQLREKIIAAAERFENRDQERFADVGEIKFLHLLSPRIVKDLAKVRFRGEKVSAAEGFQTFEGQQTSAKILGMHTLANGLSFLGVNAVSRLETPLFFIIYWDGRALRAYIPRQGNPWNVTDHTPYASEEAIEHTHEDKLDSDERDAAERFAAWFKKSSTPVVSFRKAIGVEESLILKDIKQRLAPRKAP